jgi:hypothetical protein
MIIDQYLYRETYYNKKIPIKIFHEIFSKVTILEEMILLTIKNFNQKY